MLKWFCFKVLLDICVEVVRWFLVCDRGLAWVWCWTLRVVCFSGDSVFGEAALLTRLVGCVMYLGVLLYVFWRFLDFGVDCLCYLDGLWYSIVLVGWSLDFAVFGFWWCWVCC